jgi:glycosyltransferase involved in cell wall biosynthesis
LRHHIVCKQRKEPSSVLLIDSDGLSNYTSYLARGLSLYCNIVLYGFSYQSYNITGASGQKQIKFYYLKKRLPKGYSALRGLARVFILFFILLNALLRTKYDLVHIQEHLPTFFLFIPMLKLRKKKICWTLHDVDIFSPTTRISGKLRLLYLKMVSQPSLMAKFTDNIIVHAESLKKQLVAKGIDENKIHVVRHFDYRYLLEDTLLQIKSKDILPNNYVLFFGNIAPWKGLEVLIEAAKVVRAQIGKRFDLVIAGEPYEGYQDVPFFKGLDEQDYGYVKTLGRYITNPEIRDIISRSSLLVLPYNNNFQSSASGVVPLAYTFSKPVIVSSVPSLVEYVEHGKTGFIFETNNSRQLANYIIELVDNRTNCIEMGKRAFLKMTKDMSLEKCSQDTWMVYCGVQ